MARDASPRGSTAAAPDRSPVLLWASVATVVVALGFIALRLHTTPLTADGERYRDMAISWAHTGEFRAEYMHSQYPQPGELENGHTHYFSPLWPLFQAPFYRAWGEDGFDVAVLVACALALITALVTSRDLWGDGASLAVVASLGVALERVILQRGTEPLALCFFLLMLWGILRSIRPMQERWILLAGVASGAAYLTRGSVGWLFLLGGAAGFVWRLRFHRSDALNRYYAAAIAIFGAAWAVWALRNAALFWDGTPAGLPHALTADAVFSWKFHRALDEPLRLALLIPAKLAFGLLLLSPFLWLRRRHLAWQLTHLQSEQQSGLFLAWAVPWVTGGVIGAIFTIADFNPGSPILSLDNLRYFLFAIPGILWGEWTPQAERRPWGAADERLA